MDNVIQFPHDRVRRGRPAGPAPMPPLGQQFGPSMVRPAGQAAQPQAPQSSGAAAWVFLGLVIAGLVVVDSLSYASHRARQHGARSVRRVRVRSRRRY